MELKYDNEIKPIIRLQASQRNKKFQVKYANSFVFREAHRTVKKMIDELNDEAENQCRLEGPNCLHIIIIIILTLTMIGILFWACWFICRQERFEIMFSEKVKNVVDKYNHQLAKYNMYAISGREKSYYSTYKVALRHFIEFGFKNIYDFN